MLKIFIVGTALLIPATSFAAFGIFQTYRPVAPVAADLVTDSSVTLVTDGAVTLTAN